MELGMDGNSDTNDNVSMVSKMCQQCGRKDVIKHQNPEQKVLETFIRGKKRIDYMLVSGSILPMITYTKYLPYHAMIYMDHRCLKVGFKKELFFGSRKSYAMCHARRILSLDSARKVEKYLEKLECFCEEHKVLEKCISMKDRFRMAGPTFGNICTYEKVSEMLRCGQVSAKRCCGKVEMGGAMVSEANGGW